MNIDALTPDQRACVTHVRGPLLVSAGAGSGKTFMLTQRIAYAMLNPDLSGVTDIEQVLAITFTDLAAGEIKARVRNVLRAEGLFDQALKVDACWISTIHGMCSRILRAHALELGLDPAFKLLDDTDRDELLEECIDGCLKRADYPSLFAEFGSAGADSQVVAMVRALIDAAANVEGGLDALTWKDAPAPEAIAAAIMDGMVTFDGCARTQTDAKGAPKNKSIGRIFDTMRSEVSGISAFEHLAATGCGYADVIATMAEVDLGCGGSLRSGEIADAYAEWKHDFLALRDECAVGLAQDARSELLSLTRSVQAAFDEGKRRRGALDQNDLLLLTLRAFRMHPEVRADYQDRFRLVMVDEFQDTSGLQIALIGYLTHGDDYLCTVGDTQQSIYGFRGADVATYLAHKRHMRDLTDAGGLTKELGKNFRSHGDIITFVNRIFGQDQVFDQDEFIKLGFVTDHADHNPWPASDPERIEVIATTHAYHQGNTDMRHLVEAESIARSFERLHAQDPDILPWGSMVILLGSMTRADVYARTLRAHGIPTVIAGGSGFHHTPEAREVLALTRVLANPRDDVNLRAALCGGAFGLSGDEVLALGRYLAPVDSDPKLGRHACGEVTEGTPVELRRSGFWSGLGCALDNEEAPERVRLAARLLQEAWWRSTRGSIATALTDLAVQSGWLDRLQADGAQGMAQAANLLKAIRLVDELQYPDGIGRDACQVAERLGTMIEGGMKERPGALNAAASDAVRIMTIHASKGLEFPVVALADFYGLRNASEKLLLKTIGDTIHLSLKASASLKDEKVGKLMKAEMTDVQLERYVAAGGEISEPTPADACSAGEHRRAIMAAVSSDELGELRRKFYVGATRPREALIVAVNYQVGSGGTKDVVNDLEQGLWGGGSTFSACAPTLDFGGTREALITGHVLVAKGPYPMVDDEPLASYLHPDLCRDALGGDSDDEGDRCGADGYGTDGTAADGAVTDGADHVVDIPEDPGRECLMENMRPWRVACDTRRAGTFSYSRLAKAAGDDGEAGGGDGIGDGDADEAGLMAGPDRNDQRAGAEAGSRAGSGEYADRDEVAYDPHVQMLLTAADDEAGADLPHPGGPMRKGVGMRAASPVAFGSTLHAACQWMVEDLIARRADDPDARDLRMPPDQVLSNLMRAWGVGAGAHDAIRRALGLWVFSGAAASVTARAHLAAEAPFYVMLPGPQGEPIHLEGSIDLLAWDDAGDGAPKVAHVVDYKTGGTADETPEGIGAKHHLQAMCYAFALMEQGFDAVELAFVRLQWPDAGDPTQPQTARYRFERASYQQMSEDIRRAYVKLGR